MRKKSKQNHPHPSQRSIRPILAAATLLLCAGSAQTVAGDVELPPIGGHGGRAFVAYCQPGSYLNGFDLRTGDDVDAIKPICFAPDKDAQDVSPNYFGGNGGDPRTLACPPETPAVTGIDIGWEGIDEYIVNNIHLFCGVNAVDQAPRGIPSVVFDGPPESPTRDIFGNPESFVGTGWGRASDAPDLDVQRCPYGLVVVGIHGRSGQWLDAVGLICGTPPQKPVAFATPKSHLNILSHQRTGATAPASGVAMHDEAILGHPVTPPPAGHTFSPPKFDDGALLWSCDNPQQASLHDGFCPGLNAGPAFCKLRGYSDMKTGAGGAGLALKYVPKGTLVQAMNGQICNAAKCDTISQLQCVQ